MNIKNTGTRLELCPANSNGATTRRLGKLAAATLQDEAINKAQMEDGSLSPTFNNLTVEGTVTATGLTTDSVDPAITAHAGGGQDTATALTKNLNIVTTVATAADSVTLPAASAGLRITIVNLGANALAVFPYTSDSINDAAADASVSQDPETSVTYNCYTGVLWESDNESFDTIDKLYLGTNIIGDKEVDHEITVTTTTTAATAGGKVTVRGGTGATSGAGGAVDLIGGTAGATAASVGGAINITSGVSGAGNGASGAANLKSGAATAADTGIVTVASGVPVTTGNSGNVVVSSGTGAATGNTGTVLVSSGAATTGDSGTATLKTGNATTGSSGVLAISTGTGTTASGNASIVSGNATTLSGNIASSTGTAVTTGTQILSTGNATTTAGALTISTGTASTTGGLIRIDTGNISAGTSAAIAVTTGTGTTATGAFSVTTGAATTTAGAITLSTGAAVTAGNITLTPGTASSTTVSPVVILGKGVVTKSLDTSIATGATVTGIQLVGGHLSITGGTGNITLPSAADITTAIGATPVGTRIEFVVNAVGMTAANVVTLLMGANIVTQKMISAGDSATDQLLTVTNTSNVNMGIFRLCYITATTCSLHRIG